MANPTCTVASLITNTTFLSARSLNDKEQLAVKIWFNLNELERIGGNDYTSRIVTSGGGQGSLLNAATQLFGTMNGAELAQAELAINYNNAVSAGATISTNPSTLMGSVAALIQGNGATVPQLKIMLLQLLCELGRHKSYTQ